VETLEDVVHEATGDQRFRTLLVSGFAGLALLLAALGLYGVLGYFVARRSREMGIRLALGAAPAGLFALVVRQGMGPVLVGSMAGLAAAYAVAGTIKALLFGVEPLDPGTYAASVVLLAGAALLACAFPAARAMRVDPIVALREE